MIEKQLIAQKINELQGELTTGKKALAELNDHAATLKSQMLRINGAIQVLEELLTADNEAQKVSEISPKAVGE